MPADLPNDVEEGHAAEPQLRPAMRSANELPEPWVRLAMARSRAANRPLPHSELGMIAFGLAVVGAVVLVGILIVTLYLNATKAAGVPWTWPDFFRSHLKIDVAVPNNGVAGAQFDEFLRITDTMLRWQVIQGALWWEGSACLVGLAALFMKGRRNFYGKLAVGLSVVVLAGCIICWCWMQSFG